MTKAAANSPVMDYPRRDATDKLLGRTKYTVDQGGLETLHAVLVRARVSSGKILGIDTAEALAMPGVRAIATAEDAPAPHGLGIADHPIFAEDVVRYHGEPVAAIAADTRRQALAAAAAVVISIQKTPPVLTMAEALADGAPLVHPNWAEYEILFEGAERGGNIAWQATAERGDTEAAFARDDVVVVEGCYRVGRQSHVPFEPRAVVASYEDGRYHIITSTQVPWTVRSVTAKTLGIPESRVRVTVPHVGGGFGLKFDCSLEPYAAILAQKTGRPVSLINSRQEEQMTCLCRENAEIRLRTAVTRDGKIVAREGTVLMDAGAYGGEQVFLTTMTSHTLGGNYRLPAVKISSLAVYTNTPPNGAFRACNGVYNTFALERHTDEICDAIGMGPIEFRKLNVVGDGDLGATGQVFEGDVLNPMLDRVAKLEDRKPKKELPVDKYFFGRATTVGTWFIFVGPSAATVNLNADGSATLVTSGVEIGSGTMMQSLPQMVAAELGLHPDDVVVKAADTDASGRDLGVGGGRTTVSIGAASTAACAELRKKLLSIAGEKLQTPTKNLVMKTGRIEIAGVPGSGMTIKQAVAEAEAQIGPVSGSGAFTAPGAPAMPGCAAGHFIDAIDIPVFAVHECEVAVHRETGHVEVLDYKVVQDVGRAINPRAIKSQVQGGVVQGLGYALHEEVTIDEEGKIAQRGFETYKIPGAENAIPVTLDLFEGAPSAGPLGTKGAGEIPILNVGAAIACAVSNAIGKPVSELPLTPQRIRRLMDRDAEPLDLNHISSRWQDNIIRKN